MNISLENNNNSKNSHSERSEESRIPPNVPTMFGGLSGRFEVESNKNIVPMDFGNSRVKFLLDDKFYAISYKDSWKDEILNILIQSENPNLKVIYSSVNKSATDSLLKIFEH